MCQLGPPTGAKRFDINAGGELDKTETLKKETSAHTGSGQDVREKRDTGEGEETIKKKKVRSHWRDRFQQNMIRTKGGEGKGRDRRISPTTWTQRST